MDHSDASAADAGAIGQFLGWLHVGRVPLLMLVILFLTGFAIVGLVLQWVLAAAGRPAAAGAGGGCVLGHAGRPALRPHDRRRLVGR
ncbi:hypothetical protein ACU4GD_19740 [Cupriavidus basilensis]